MLIDFKIKNYKSFSSKNASQLNLRSSNSRSHGDHISSNGILLQSAIFGGNGAGKTNLLDGIRFVRYFILNNDFPSSSDSLYCKNDDNQDRICATRFEFIIQLDEKTILPLLDPRYVLSKKFDNDRILGKNCSIRNYRYVLEIGYLRTKIRTRAFVSKEYVEQLDDKYSTINLIFDNKEIFDRNKNFDAEIDENLLKTQLEINENESEFSYLEVKINEAKKNLTDLRMLLAQLSTERTMLVNSNVGNNDLDIVIEKMRQSEAEMDKLNVLIDISTRKQQQIRYNIDSLKHQCDRFNRQKKMKHYQCIGSVLNEHRVRFRNYFNYFRRMQGFDLTESQIASTLLVDWFRNKLEIIEPDGYMIPSVKNDYIDELSAIINKFDLGIEKLKWSRIDDDGVKEDKMRELPPYDRIRILGHISECAFSDDIFAGHNVIVNTDSGIYKYSIWSNQYTLYELSTIHNNPQLHNDNKDKNEVNLLEESSGTRRIIELCSIILDNNDDKTYIVDELDHRLHPLLSRRFVELFMLYNRGMKQLIFTTHEPKLMDTKLLRKDELWFVQLDDNWHSQLYRVSDLNIPPGKSLQLLFSDDELEHLDPIWRG